jgi:hypothetical protein
MSARFEADLSEIVGRDDYNAQRIVGFYPEGDTLALVEACDPVLQRQPHQGRGPEACRLAERLAERMYQD